MRNYPRIPMHELDLQHNEIHKARHGGRIQACTRYVACCRKCQSTLARKTIAACAMSGQSCSNQYIFSQGSNTIWARHRRSERRGLDRMEGLRRESCAAFYATVTACLTGSLAYSTLYPGQTTQKQDCAVPSCLWDHPRS